MDQEASKHREFQNFRGIGVRPGQEP